MYRLTIFTPAYNRRETLKRTYKSLCDQSNREFEWLIVDDGSTDNTGELVQQWIKENKIAIRYIYKENGGLHTGYSVAIENTESELCMCIDSDDFLPANSVEIILGLWEKHKTPDLAGIIGLDYEIKWKKPIGGYFKKADIILRYVEIFTKLRHFFDVKIVSRTAFLKPFVPLPTFNGEKNFNPSILYYKVNPDYKYYITNNILCFYDYQDDGMTSSIYRQYVNSPYSFAEMRKVRIAYPYESIVRKVKYAGHLFSTALITKDFNVLKGKYNKLYLVPGVPLGLMIYALVKYKTRKKA